MHVRRAIKIDAPAHRIFEVMTDVERWPEWSPSMQRVERLDTGEFRVGSAARVKQPGAPAAVWRVTSVTPDREFTWETARPGMRMVATHRIEERMGGGSIVTLAVRTFGLVASLMTPLIRGTAARYVEIEAQGLKRRAESLSGNVEKGFQ